MSALPTPVLLTTCHLQKDGLDDLFRLVASVGAALDQQEVASLQHIILLQGCNSTRREEVQRQMPQWVTLLSTQESLSSPAARNAMLEHLRSEGSINPDAFVGFPDDDCWYPRGALACIGAQFETRPLLQLLVSRYGPSPSADRSATTHHATLQQALSRSACHSFFLRGGLLAQLGGFHELLGLGTQLRGGEDTEFVHRAFHCAVGEAAYVPGTLIGHAAAGPAKKARYYEGGLAAVMAHSHASSSARLALIRKLAAGLWLVVRQHMSAGEYVRSLRKARAYAPILRAGIAAAQASPELEFSRNA